MPDLYIHPSFYSLVHSHYLKISNYFNVHTIKDLEIILNYPLKVILKDRCISTPVTIRKPYPQIHLSGDQPAMVSYSFKEPLKSYHIEQSAPRYIIWTKRDLLPINGTYVNRIEDYEITHALLGAIDWSMGYTLTKNASIIVFDLDNTLIDDENNKVIGADKVLNIARRKYDLVVLWSHGSSLHVDENVRKFTNIRFDLKLNCDTEKNLSPKNLLYLYNFFPTYYFTKSALVDDSLFNFCPEYNLMIVPTLNNLNSVEHLL